MDTDGHTNFNDDDFKNTVNRLLLIMRVIGGAFTCAALTFIAVAFKLSEQGVKAQTVNLPIHGETQFAGVIILLVILAFMVGKLVQNLEIKKPDPGEDKPANTPEGLLMASYIVKLALLEAASIFAFIGCFAGEIDFSLTATVIVAIAVLMVASIPSRSSVESFIRKSSGRL
ncbi:MAG: hypothetical protein D6719_02915 [Candidatus Dadabacteria bacterium]|nr:MAG: hypothetical protein D6719_02915 [Candidatus Dadabacteria bacterium]